MEQRVQLLTLHGLQRVAAGASVTAEQHPPQRRRRDRLRRPCVSVCVRVKVSWRACR